MTPGGPSVVASALEAEAQAKAKLEREPPDIMATYPGLSPATEYSVGVKPAPIPVSLSAPDPWRHRSAGMLCASCMWYVRKAGLRELGRCRRHAPTMNGYPAVFPDDWCGDHKLDENKL